MTDAVVLSWSGGKDGFIALTTLEADPDITITALLTTLTDPFERVSMHGTREDLLDAQAAALGLPLAKARLPEKANNVVYRECFAAALAPFTGNGSEGGLTAVAFGDLFLADVREFREAQMRALGLAARFPLWHTPTGTLARDFIDSGHRAVVVCVDAEQLAPQFLGREYDAAFLADLPQGADPCGENGEFHSFVYAGPRFARPVEFRRGRKVVRDGRFHFLDLERTDA
ncbi:MAG: hypothetical protein ACRESR_03740 [Gammaproteobacteria bacterium]